MHLNWEMNSDLTERWMAPVASLFMPPSSIVYSFTASRCASGSLFWSRRPSQCPCHWSPWSQSWRLVRYVRSQVYHQNSLYGRQTNGQINICSLCMPSSGPATSFATWMVGSENASFHKPSCWFQGYRSPVYNLFTKNLSYTVILSPTISWSVYLEVRAPTSFTLLVSITPPSIILPLR